MVSARANILSYLPAGVLPASPLTPPLASQASVCLGWAFVWHLFGTCSVFASYLVLGTKESESAGQNQDPSSPSVPILRVDKMSILPAFSQEVFHREPSRN